MSELQSTTGFLDVQSASLYYEIAGQGYPLLLLHAGIADSRMWDEQFPVFAQHYRTLRYDLRGYGKSHWSAGAFAAYEDPLALFQALGISQAHVLGISFGARIALDFALAHPELVKSLTLVAPSVSGEPMTEAIRHFVEEEDALVEGGDLPGATELNLRFWVDGPQRSPAQVNAQVRQRVYEMQYHAFNVPMPEDTEEQELQPPALARLAEVQMPTLVIIGDLDLPEKQALSEQLASSIPAARKVVIAGAAHMVSMERPEEFNRAVLDFLNGL